MPCRRCTATSSPLTASSARWTPSASQVDDGTYELQGDDAFVIGNVTFHYSISPDGTTLMLDPVLPACAEQGCWDAQWAVAVAYPGLTWERTG